MIWAATGMTFVATVLILLAVAYALFSTSQPIGDRLGRLWNPSSAPTQVPFRQKQKERAQKVLTDVGKLLPTSTKQLSHTRRLMVRAGYRRQEAATAMYGAKILLPAGLLSLVYFTKIYIYNPALILVGAGIVGFLLPELWLLSWLTIIM